MEDFFLPGFRFRLERRLNLLPTLYNHLLLDLSV
jgi:hypothetical protein